MKRHRFRHHPLHAFRGLMLGEEEEYGGIIQLELIASNVLLVEDTSSTQWRLLANLRDYSGFGDLPPADAIAAVLDVAVRDADGKTANYYLELATPGIIYASKTQIVYAGDVDDRWQSRLVIVEMSDEYEIAAKVTASVGGLDYMIKLIGWVIDPSMTRPSIPSEDLFCKFRVNQ